MYLNAHTEDWFTNGTWVLAIGFLLGFSLFFDQCVKEKLNHGGFGLQGDFGMEQRAQRQ